MKKACLALLSVLLTCGVWLLWRRRRDRNQPFSECFSLKK